MNSSFAKNGLAVFGANFLASIFSLLRNILLARMLGPENYGVGAIFVLVLTFLDMASNLSFDRQIVQSEKGFDQSFINNIHFAEFVKGVILALFMYLGAPIYGGLLGVGSIQWAFELLSLVPLIRGLRNWGIAVEQKDSKFRSTIYVEVIPQLLSLMAIWPLLYFVDDYRVFIYVTFIQAVMLVIASQLSTKIKYSLEYDREFTRSIVRFGWPLLLNGFLIFLFLQGDRILISRYYDLEVLGYFSAAFSLSTMPLMILGKALNTLFLPLLSIKDHMSFEYSKLLWYLCGVLSLLYAAFMYSCGTVLYTTIYGGEYVSGAYLLCLIGYVHAVRIMRIAPVIVATSCANTKSILYANLIRGIGFALAVYSATVGMDIIWIIISAGVGEILALLYQVFLVKYSNRFLFGNTVEMLRFISYLGVAFVACYIFVKPISNLWGMGYSIVLLSFILSISLFIYIKWMSEISNAKNN